MEHAQLIQKMDDLTEELAGLIKHLNDISDPGVYHELHIDYKGTVTLTDYFPPDIVIPWRREP